MEIIIHVHSRKIDNSYQNAIDEYVKRCSFFCKMSVKTYKKSTVPSVRPGSKCFIIESSVDTISSPELAEIINDTCVSGFSRIEFVVPYKLDTDALIIDTSGLGFSSFAMSGELTAVALTEQIYRAFTILNNITYHK